jgi:hypothetical protein
MEMTLPVPMDLMDDRSVAANPEEDVRSQVFALVSALYRPHHQAERRRETRYPFPFLIHLTPVDRTGAVTSGETVVVAGKDISEHGLGFYHPKPLPYRRVIASLQSANGHWSGFLVDLKWCRFTRQGWYESGGRFLQAVPSPVEEAKR